MCTNYNATPRDRLPSIVSAMRPPKPDWDWPHEIYNDYAAPIIRLGEDGPEVILASYAMVPKQHIPPGVKKFSTMNARAETIGEKRSYSKQWRDGQLCLVPMESFYEPCYETGVAVRWNIGMADDAPFAVAGLWRSWNEPDGSTAHSFTQITVNADEHPLMKRFHKPGDEKRSLVIVPESEYEDWLECHDPERARSYLQLYPAELMAARPAPAPPRKKKAEPNGVLF
ncbi:SOS response-associated peptidase family protein [Collimonas sp. H4R21]|uniref:Abasic site processing protein n=1 Tax=Collimonas rhizosphaerae TaxID=3126357 RepID=A0ABU9PXX8_9BURK